MSDDKRDRADIWTAIALRDFKDVVADVDPRRLEAFANAILQAGIELGRRSAETKTQPIVELASKLFELEGALRGVLRSTLSYVEHRSGETGDSLRWQEQVIRRIKQALGDET